MTKTTVAKLEAKLDAVIASNLEATENMRAWAKRAQDHIVNLEHQVAALRTQEEKTKKQLWWLQKSAKGEFKAA